MRPGGALAPFVNALLAVLLMVVMVAPHACLGVMHYHMHKLHTETLRPILLQQDGPQLWFTQTLDHFNPQDNRTFQQRYYELIDNFVDPHGPIFLDICGEAECSGIFDSFYLALAEEVKAAYVSLEHRYYGKSIPGSDLSTQNLAYLSTGQALYDLASFRDYYQKQINERFNLSESHDNPWIVLGGSYAGAMSAWFRVKFPHLVRGSISSSGVVNSIENYQLYDVQLGESLGPVCGPAYRKLTRRLEKELKRNATHIKSLFNATQLNDGDFAMLLGSFPAGHTQFGDQQTACYPILEAIKNGTDLLEAYVEALSFLKGSTEFFDSKILNDTDPDVDVGRQWTYQQCSEVGFFVTAASRNNVFMHPLNQNYYLEICANIFGNGTYPNTEVTNLNYGATKISGSRILFMNGSQDPWRHACKQTSRPSEESVLITCDNCAHCVDILGCPPFLSRGDPSSCSSPENVTQARNIMRSSIREWIAS